MLYLIIFLSITKYISLAFLITCQFLSIGFAVNTYFAGASIYQSIFDGIATYSSVGFISVVLYCMSIISLRSIEKYSYR